MASFVPQSYLYQLANLKSQVLSDSVTTIYVLTGNQNAGKKTLIHYMIDSNMEHGIDEQGQDILTIHEQQQRQFIIENVLQTIKCQDRQLLFIKLIGFLSSSRDQQQKKKWALCVDYLIRLLSLKKQSNIKFILIFSLQQLQEDDQILAKYYNAFKQIPDLQSRTHIVLSKLVDEDQFNEFVQITSEQILLPEQNTEFLKEIIINDRIFGFYSRQIDQTERYQFNEKIEGTFVEQNLDINKEGQSILQLFHEYQLDLNQVFEQHYQYLKIGLKLINSLYIDVLTKVCNIEDKNNLEEIKQLIEKLYGEQKSYGIKGQIEQQKTFIEKYENNIKKSRQSGHQFLIQFFSQDRYLDTFLNAQSCDFIASTEILLIICMVSSEKTATQVLQSQQLINIFTHDNGVLQDHHLAKAFNSHKTYFSKEFIEANEKLLSKGGAKKKKKKVAQKNLIPSYEEQKKGFGEKPICQIQEMVYSPLKLDLLLECVDKARKNNPRNIRQQKRIINHIIKVLEVYRCYLDAAKFAFVFPQNYLLLTEIYDFLNSDELKRGEDLSLKDKQFIDKVCTYFSRINRPELVQKISKTLQNITEEHRTDRSNLHSLKQKINTLTYTSDNEQIVKEAKSRFMNYEEVFDILKNKQSLIEKCINFEANEPQAIQKEIVIKWILTTDQIKLAL